MPPSRPKLSKVNEAAARNAAKAQAPPLWEGPNGAGPNGGVTNGLLARFLVCRARFRVWAIDGLRPAEHFNPRLEFGNMWHAMEEARADPEGDEDQALVIYVDKLCRQYPTERDDIGLWADKANALFHQYTNYWVTDAKDRTPLFQEQVFSAPYRLPSGRTVRLRGKWDGAHVDGGGVWLDEHKTKSGIDAQKLVRELTFDLQTMLYLVSLRDRYDRMGWAAHGPLLGVRYNVVRRPLHKSVESMLDKVELDLRNNRAAEWFCRFEVRVTPEDVARFRRECLDPVLEQLWDWWDYVTNWNEKAKTRYATAAGLHFRFPYGVYNPLSEGGAGDVDEYLNTGSRAGLHRTEVLFPELQE